MFKEQRMIPDKKKKISVKSTKIKGFSSCIIQFVYLVVDYTPTTPTKKKKKGPVHLRALPPAISSTLRLQRDDVTGCNLFIEQKATE